MVDCVSSTLVPTIKQMLNKNQSSQTESMVFHQILGNPQHLDFHCFAKSLRNNIEDQMISIPSRLTWFQFIINFIKLKNYKASLIIVFTLRKQKMQVILKTIAVTFILIISKLTYITYVNKFDSELRQTDAY